MSQPMPRLAQAHDEPLLSVHNLHTWFELRRFGFFRAGYVRAVDGVDFELRRGETVAVVGESGCGKSSLARTILGLHTPTAGKIIFKGKEIISSDDLRWYRAQVGYVQQDPYGALPPFMNVERILEEPLIINGVKQRQERLQRIREVLSDVRLLPVDDYLAKYPHMLSGGQRQRLVIARALIMRPRLVIADEPVSMLDASVRIEILELLRRLQRSYELSLIYITHDLSTVRYFADRILVMYGAKIVEQSGADLLIDQPRHPYTQALIHAIPDADPANAGRMREVPPGEPPSLLNPPSGCRFHPRCPVKIAGLCEVQEPPEYQLSAGNRTRCWLYREEA